MQRPVIAFLIGAGASYGAGEIHPFLPPMGGGLFKELRSAFPETWGALLDEEIAAFGSDGAEFEAGMNTLWERFDHHERVGFALIDMARYFSRFRPPLDRSDCYTRLMIALRALGLIDATAAASLNYECLFEYGCSAAGVEICIGQPTPGQLLLAKPHGSCNFFSPLQISGISLALSHPGQSYVAGGQPEIVSDLDEIEKKYDSGYSLPPIMSLYAESKHTPVSREFVEQMRGNWRDWVESAELIVIIGAQPYFRDQHLWNPILDASAAVWYIGGTNSADFLHFASQLGPRLDRLGREFDKNLARLLERLRDFRDRRLQTRQRPGFC